MLKIQNLTKKFSRDVEPLKGIDLMLESSQKIALLGKSGEGKSTLAKIICGFYKPSGGTVTLDGEPLYDKKNRYNRKLGVKVQMISQQPFQSLDPLQRVGSALLETVKVQKCVKGRDRIAKAVADLFDRVGLEQELKNRLPTQLSGGQCQRVAIARALAVEPKVLIADESTCMLDVSAQKQIIDLYLKLAAESLAVILITHDLTLAQSFANEIYTLQDGRLVLSEGANNYENKHD